MSATALSDNIKPNDIFQYGIALSQANIERRNALDIHPEDSPQIREIDTVIASIKLKIEETALAATTKAETTLPGSVLKGVSSVAAQANKGGLTPQDALDYLKSLAVNPDLPRSIGIAHQTNVNVVRLDKMATSAALGYREIDREKRTLSAAFLDLQEEKLEVESRLNAKVRAIESDRNRYSALLSEVQSLAHGHPREPSPGSALAASIAEVTARAFLPRSQSKGEGSLSIPQLSEPEIHASKSAAVEQQAANMAESHSNSY